MFLSSNDQNKKLKLSARPKNKKSDTKRKDVRDKGEREKEKDQQEMTMQLPSDRHNAKTKKKKSKIHHAQQAESTLPPLTQQKSEQGINVLGQSTSMTKLSKKPSSNFLSAKDKQELSEVKKKHSSLETLPPTAPTPKLEKKEEKWAGEEAALLFIDKIDSLVARTEFQEINTILCDTEKCLIWKKNKIKNQSEKFPCYDHNIVKNPNSPDDYINATSLQVPNVSRNILLGQIPRKDVGGSVEEFWKTIFQENIMLMHILVGSDEVADFFPQLANAYEHYGSMFVNNRKTEKTDAESVKFLMEVLPTGFSNSNMINIVMHLNWNPQNVPPKFSKTLKSAIDVLNFVQSSPPDEKCIIISKHGVGRAGFFISLCSAVNSLNNKIEPKLVNIVKTVREQRPYAVESFKQYTSLYLCLVYYIKKKLNDPKLNQKTGEINEAFKCLLEGAGTSMMPPVQP